MEEANETREICLRVFQGLQSMVFCSARSWEPGSVDQKAAHSSEQHADVDLDAESPKEASNDFWALTRVKV